MVGHMVKLELEAVLQRAGRPPRLAGWLGLRGE
jgi:hypothetical protein